MEQWKSKLNGYPNFFGLRDFYNLIKIFMKNLKERPTDHEIGDTALLSIFKNFNGWKSSQEEFKQIFL